MKKFLTSVKKLTGIGRLFIIVVTIFVAVIAFAAAFLTQNVFLRAIFALTLIAIIVESCYVIFRFLVNEVGISFRITKKEEKESEEESDTE